MEPEWMKQIPSEVVCNFFYVFFVIYAVILAIAVVGFAAAFVSVKMPKGLLVISGLQAFLTMAIGTTMMLFYYLVCDRALKPGSEVAKKVDEAFTNMRRD